MNSPMQAFETDRARAARAGRQGVARGPRPQQPGDSLFQVLRAQVVRRAARRARARASGRRPRRAGDAALVYYAPDDAVPLGVRTSAERRSRAAATGPRQRRLDHRGQLQRRDRPTTAAARRGGDCGTRWHHRDRVLLMGTLEGIMFPALRVWPTGGAGAPGRGLRRDARHARRPHQQRAAARAGTVHRRKATCAVHLRNLRQVGRERRDALRASCARHLPPGHGSGRWTAAFTPASTCRRAVSDREVVRRMREAGVSRGRAVVGLHRTRGRQRPGDRLRRAYDER